MKPKFGYIYKITNLINSKIYIGQTIRSLQCRFNQHIYRSGCIYLHNAIKKYGKENFKIEEIEYISTDLLDEREIYWINYYNSTNKDIGYNILKGGKLGQTGIFKLTEEETSLLIEMDRNNVSHIKIGEYFNINRKTVTFILKRNINYTNKRVQLEERNDLKEIKEYIINNNPTMKEVCDKFRIGRNTLSKLAKSINYHFLTYNERLKLGI